MIFVTRWNDTQHRAKHFLARDLGIVVNVGENRRLNKKAAIQVRWPPPTGSELHAICNRTANEMLDALTLSAGCQGTYAALRVKRVSHTHGLEGLTQCIDQLIVAVAGNNDARQRRTDLTRQRTCRPNNRLGSNLRIDII